MLNFFYYIQASFLEKNGKWKTALSIYQKIAKSEKEPSANLAYRIGFTAAKVKNWKLAEIWLSQAVQRDQKKAQWFYRLALAQEMNKKFSLAAQTYAKAIELQPKNAKYLYRQGKALWITGRGEEAEAALHRALAIEPQNALYTHELVMAIRKQGRTWQEVEALQAALALDPTNAQWQFELGDAQDKMNHFAEAGQAFAQANNLQPGNALWHFREGWAWERAEQQEKANAAYAEAITADIDLQAKALGVGVFHQQRGFWAEAARAYAHAARSEPCNAELKYRLGLAHDRCYRWEQAIQCYRQALLLNPHKPNWHYRLGFALERLECWEEAAQAYRSAVARSNTHNRQWYYRLGYVLTQMGQLQQATTAFLDTYIFKQAHGVDMSRYEKNSGLMQVMEYTEFLETLSIEKNTILYESFLGASLGCNPYAIYEEIIDRPEFCEFTHIWVVNDETQAPFDFTQRQNVIFIKRQSSAYRRYVATAEYLINNVTFPTWFIRREGQKYLNTWHGTPLKGLGKDMPGEFMVHGNVTRNFLHASHIISSNVHTSDVLMKSYDVAGIFNGNLAETGYPRIDRTLNSTPEKILKIKNHLGLNSDLPVVLYAPTWRGMQGNLETDVEKILTDIHSLKGREYQLVFRGHHFVETALKSIGMPVAVAGADIDANELLAAVDILVTDYSSILFDFLPTKRPIIYYAYDLDEYREKRGLYFELESMPGSLCRTTYEVVDAIRKELADPEIYQADEIFACAYEKFSKLEDGESTQRVIDFFFNGVGTYNVDRYSESKKVALFYNGHFIPNGITSSFLNLFHSIPGDRYINSLAFDPALIRGKPGFMEKISSLPKDIKLLPKEGRMLITPEEMWLENQFMKYGIHLEKSMREMHKNIYNREFIRLYGLNNKFEKIINFEGYNGYWTQVLAHAGDGKDSFIWLHNDMLKEYELRFPYLSRNFAAYTDYGKVISVSSLMNEINKYSLSQLLEIADEKFSFCENTINYDEILKKADEPLDEDLDPWFSGTTLLTIGRMSPEKDHEKLIRAFAQVKTVISDTKLIILGDGPLRKYLEYLIKSLGIQDRVLLAGQRSNPFPALKACSCFILPSNHEGQPMVLLEALTLGKKIIATDIDGNRGVLSKYNGNLVENSINGIAKAILDLVDGNIQDTNFNADFYCNSAINMFFETIELNHICRYEY